MPQFDLTTDEGLQDAIQYVNDQTQPETIPNTLIADILKALKGRDISLNNEIQIRKLLNAISPIQNSGIGLIYLSNSNYPQAFTANEINFTLNQQGYESENLKLTKGGNWSQRYALGSPIYEIFTAEEITGDGLTGTQFGLIQMSRKAYGSYQNYEVAFGGSLGSIPSGSSLGEFNQNFNLSIYQQDYGLALEKKNVQVTFTDLTNGNSPFKVRKTGTYLQDVELQPNTTIQTHFIGVWNYLRATLYMENPTNYVLDQNIKIEVIKNGQINGSTSYSIGEQFSPYFMADYGGWDNLVEGDVLEFKISNY